MAPGVGKTYKMLQEAQALKQTGIDVIIGILETHGRTDTARQSIGLEILPRIGSDSVNANFLEMDINRIIQRQPQLVLVDELAHTNIPGSDREKRYQDVELILDAGIDVYSTVNIQHLESLNDIVAKITGVIVRERIPDRLLEAADEVVLVDVTPETLEERLIDGKIYKPEKPPFGMGKKQILEINGHTLAMTLWPDGAYMMVIRVFDPQVSEKPLCEVVSFAEGLKVRLVDNVVEVEKALDQKRTKKFVKQWEKCYTYK